MKTLAFLLSVITLTGCATSNPLMTGKPQDWMWKPAAELKTALGEPTRVIPQQDGAEIWEYVTKEEFVAPGEEKMTFGAGKAPFGGIAGGSRTTKRGERASSYVNTWRYLIRDGKVRKWYAERMEDGKVVWSDH